MSTREGGLDELTSYDRIHFGFRQVLAERLMTIYSERRPKQINADALVRIQS